MKLFFILLLSALIIGILTGIPQLYYDFYYIGSFIAWELVSFSILSLLFVVDKFAKVEKVYWFISEIFIWACSYQLVYYLLKGVEINFALNYALFGFLCRMIYLNYFKK